MPNRIIRESIRTCPVLANLSPEAERLYHRLTTVADDYGRFDADPRVLLANCLPLLIETITSSLVGQWRDELSASGLIRLYEVAGRRYGHFPTWAKEQRRYNLRPKFPEPPVDSRNFRETAGSSGNAPQTAGISGSLSVSDALESEERSDIRNVSLGEPSSARERVIKIIGDLP